MNITTALGLLCEGRGGEDLITSARPADPPAGLVSGISAMITAFPALI